MLSVDYYHKLKDLYRQEVSKSMFIYIYTSDAIVQQVLFRYRKKNKYCLKKDVPHDKLLLSRDKQLPKDVIVQVKQAPLEFTLMEA